MKRPKACRRATWLIAQSMDRPLRWGERWSLAAHLLVCRPCGTFRRQVRFLRELIRRMGGRDLARAILRGQLSDEGRARMQQAIEEAR